MHSTAAILPRIVQDLPLIWIDAEYHFLLRFVGNLEKSCTLLKEQRDSSVCVGGFRGRGHGAVRVQGKLGVMMMVIGSTAAIPART